MNTKNILMGGLVAAIVYFLLGWLVYGNLTVDFFHNHGGAGYMGITSQVERGDKNMLLWAIGIGNLGSGILLAFIFDRSGIRNFSAGLVTGAIIGCLTSISYKFVVYGVTNLMDKNAVVVSILLWTVISAIAGAICGMVIGKTGGKAIA